MLCIWSVYAFKKVYFCFIVCGVFIFRIYSFINMKYVYKRLYNIIYEWSNIKYKSIVCKSTLFAYLNALKRGIISLLHFFGYKKCDLAKFSKSNNERILLLHSPYLIDLFYILSTFKILKIFSETVFQLR